MDYYREWSYQDRCDARDRGEREAVAKWDADSESSERAYSEYRSGGEFRDNVPDQRFS